MQGVRHIDFGSFQLQKNRNRDKQNVVKVLLVCFKISGWEESERGLGVVFGEDIIGRFLHGHELDLIIRAREPVPNGYEFYGEKGLISLFSAPDYQGEGIQFFGRFDKNYYSKRCVFEATMVRS